MTINLNSSSKFSSYCYMKYNTVRNILTLCKKFKMAQRTSGTLGLQKMRAIIYAISNFKIEITN